MQKHGSLSESSAARCVRIVCDSANGTQYDRVTAARLNEKTQAIAERKRDKAERRRRIEIFLHMMEEQKERAGFESGRSWRRWIRRLSNATGAWSFASEMG